MTDSEQKFDEKTLEKKRSEFNIKMEEYKKQFEETYKKPENVTIYQKESTQELIDKELKRISDSNRKKFEELNTEGVFSDEKIQKAFDSIPSEQNLFQPQLEGFSRVYSLSSEEAVAQLDNRAKFLNKEGDNNNSHIEKFDKRIDDLLKKAIKAVSANQSVIDINKKEGFELLVTIAEFFDTGLNGSAHKVFNKLSDIERTNVSLQTSIIHANSSNDNQKNLRYLTKFVYVMLTNLQCSNLIRTLNFDDYFLRTYYFYDAPIRDPFVAESIALKIEQVERYQIEGELDEKKAKDFTPPVEGKLFVKRVQETVDEYLNTIRVSLLEDVNIGQGQLNLIHLPKLVVIFKLFAQVFLTQKSGEIVSIGNLWDVFKSIASLDKQGSSFSKFQKVLKKKEVTSSLNTKNRVWHALVEIYNEKILPDVLTWGFESKLTRSSKDPAYYRDRDLCNSISKGFKPFSYPTIKVEYDEIVEYIDDDE